MKKKEAIALFSGGLDSSLAIKIIQEQNIKVTAIHINMGFGGTKDNSEYLKKMTKQLNVPLEIIDIREQFIQNILFSPKYGYGKNFNPCIDCHANMFRVAKKKMQELGADFIISGEVLGQRPMSQGSIAMKQVLKLAKDEEENIILRPLSAKLMQETKAEIKKWVDRDKLFSISGRSRSIQLELANKFDLKDFESPAGGCLLTDINFSNKIKEFIKFDKLDKEDGYILKYGRHLRLPDGAKLIIGRNKDDNEMLKNYKSKKYMSVFLEIVGPFSLINKNATLEDKKLASKIILTYTKSKVENLYNIIFNEVEKIENSPFPSRENISKYLI